MNLRPFLNFEGT